MSNLQWLNRHSVEKHSLDMRQFADFRLSTLPDGSHIIEAYNASGLTFTLLPDRGMDIWSASYNGMPLTWIAPGSPHIPDWGQSWLTQFNGGLLTTCGLTHTGPPETDPDTGEQRRLHGDYTRLRAQNITVQSGWLDKDRYELRLNADIYQTSLFGEQLHLNRQISLVAGEPNLHLRDTVTNMGDTPAPLMILYHCNLGYPLIHEGAELLVNSTVYPRDQDGWSGATNWNHYHAAQTAYAEQVFFHHVRHDSEKGRASAAVVTENLGLAFDWQTDTLPYLTQWKNTRQGIYVSGIEPGNCIPEGQNSARQHDRLVTLVPGAVQRFQLRLSILAGTDATGAYRETLAGTSDRLLPIPGCNLSDYQAYQVGE